MSSPPATRAAVIQAETPQIETPLDRIMAERWSTPNRRENAMEKMMLRFGIGYNTLLNTSTSHIAEMIIKGSNNGVLEMEKVLAHNEEFAGSPCRSLAKELIEMENANIRTLKEYL